MSVSSPRRYLSLWLRRLATDRLTRGQNSPAPAETALVVAAEVKSALRLAALNDAAARLGLRLGMALADARAMYPAIAVADADPAADRRLLTAIADWCDRYTPLVGLDPPDGLVLDVTGCAHLFGGEAALGRDLVRRLAAQGFQARVAVADTVGCASAMARYGEAAPPTSPPPERGRTASAASQVGVPLTLPLAKPSERRVSGTPTPNCLRQFDPPPFRGREDCLVIPATSTRDALLPLPLAALRIAAETVEALAQVGLKRIADVIERPRAPLAARFGEEFLRRLDQALGRADEPITPRLPVPSYVAEQRFPEPILLEADVLATIAHLANELARLMERRGEGARRLEVALFRTDGKVRRIAVGTGAPLRDARRIAALFAERLAAVGEACDPGFGFDVIRLATLAAERCDPVQTGLAAPDHAAELAHLIDRLGARFGLRRVTRLEPQDTHIPEFAVAAVPAARIAGAGFSQVKPHVSAHPRGGGGPDFASQRSPVVGSWVPASAGMSGSRINATGIGSRSAFSQAGDDQDSLAPVRPIHLFERPERIEAMAEVPDGPPVQFTWRRVRHQVAHAEGPERIAMPWWRDETGRALTRDYFRIESREGVRLWIYREGLYGRETRSPRWFLHGLFA